MVSIIWIAGLFLPLSAEPRSATRASAPTTAVATTSTAGPITLFIDRFGTLYLSRKPISLEAALQAIKDQHPTGKSIVLLYDPISLEVDRRRLYQAIEATYPKIRIVLRTAEGDEYAPWLFPDHQPEILEQILLQQGLSDEPSGSKSRTLIDQLESYLTDMVVRSNQIHSQLVSFEQEYQHLTTQRSKGCCR